MKSKADEKITTVSPVPSPRLAPPDSASNNAFRLFILVASNGFFCENTELYAVSFQYHTTESMKVTRYGEIALGSIILINVEASPQPSMRAASSSSFGIDRKYCINIQINKPDLMPIPHAERI